MHQGPAGPPADAEGAPHEAAGVDGELLSPVGEGVRQVGDLVLDPQTHDLAGNVLRGHAAADQLVLRGWGVEEGGGRAPEAGVAERGLEKAW